MSLITDQNQTIDQNTSAGFGEVAGVRYRGQVFTPTQSRVDAVRFYCQFDGGGTIGFKIFFYNVNQSTNIPTTEIYSFTVAAGAYTQNKFNRFTLPAPITTLTPGTKYCFYIAPWNTSTDQYSDYYRDLKWSSTTSHYTGGVALVNNNGTWSTDTLRMYFQLDYERATPTFTDDYTQPVLPSTSSGWKINGLDYQIVTKSDGWNQDQTKRFNEYDAGKNLCGINYAALAVPYDNLVKYTNYVADARTKGLKVWHRSHWNAWQGDNNFKGDQSAQEYLDRTYYFIVDNPTLFADYDCFTFSVECNNADGSNTSAPFRTAGSFSFTKYNQFLKDQVRYANAAFAAIGKRVQTNLLSLSLSLSDLNGQTLDSGDGGNASGLDNNDIVTYLNGILTIDHYLSDSYRYSDASTYWSKFSSDLDKLHTAFPDCQIMIGEWGYHTTTSVSESERAGMYQQIIDVLRSKNYIYGVCFWNHMGQTSSSVFTDSSGTIVTTGRTAADRIKHGFSTGNRSYGMRIRVT